MKQQFLFLFAALLMAGAVSCNKPQDSPVPEAPQQTLKLRIGIPDEQSKVVANTTNVKDFRINSVQVFVFNDPAGQGGSSAKLETDYYYAPASPAEGSISVTLNTTSNQKTIYVVANRARMYRTRGTYSMADFEAELTDLTENSLTGLLMAGKVQADVDPENIPQDVYVFLKRLVCMVKLTNLKVDFGNSSLSGATFTLKGMYLKNAVGRARMALSGYTDTDGTDACFLSLSIADHNNGNYWYNKHTRTNDSPALLVDDGCNDACNTGGTATAIGRCLFAYPNQTLSDIDSHSSSATWVPRLTRITLKAHVSKNANGVSVDEDTFYTFDLPELEANLVYDIRNIHITQMGKADDNSDSNVQGGQIMPTVTVDEWDSDVVNLNYEF